MATGRNEALSEMLKYLDHGMAVLTAGEQHPDIPTIHEVGPGRRINTPEVRHCGFGVFKAGEYTFCGGGAMYHTDDHSLAWTILSGPDVAGTGYDLGKARRAVRNMLRES